MYGLPREETWYFSKNEISLRAVFFFFLKTHQSKMDLTRDSNNGYICKNATVQMIYSVCSHLNTYIRIGGRKKTCLQRTTIKIHFIQRYVLEIMKPCRIFAV